MEKKENKAIERSAKKQIKVEILNKVSGALTDYRDVMKKKKLERNLKKASKIFFKDIFKALQKEQKSGTAAKQ